MRIPLLARFVALILLVHLGMVTQVTAQTIASSPDDSLAAALKILTEPTGRSLSAAGDPAAAEIDRQVQALTGSPQLAQEVYALAAQVFADLLKSTGGDMGKLTETLERARTDPAGFAAGLSPQTLQRLSELSEKIAAAKR
jgi:hypothetical protein